MQSVLIVFATREGQTEKIALRISEHLEHSGFTTQVVNAKDSLTITSLHLDSYDLIVFGASMHAGGLESEIVSFINNNADEIRFIPSSFFLVLLSAATKEPNLKRTTLSSAQRQIEKQLNVPFEDTEMIAGALQYSKYSTPIKWIMRRISKTAGEDTVTSRDYEYTDWKQVREYARRLTALIGFNE